MQQNFYFVAFATYKGIRCKYYSELSYAIPCLQLAAATKYQLLLRLCYVLIRARLIDTKQAIPGSLIGGSRDR